jgi:uncharacterized membrane protein YdjX (TVP38/TMEM64 family)
MPPADHPLAKPEFTSALGPRLLRTLPLAVVVLATVMAFSLGWHRNFTLEALVAHRASIEAYVAVHGLTAVLSYVALYVAVVALSLPCAGIMTVSGGLLFGTVTGWLAALLSATIGGTIIFLIARTAVGEWLVRRAGSRASKIAAGFRADAFKYLLVLRLVPLFPFWLVNLVPAVAGIGLWPFIAATALGMIPVTFVFAFFGASLDTAIAGQQASYRDCLATGATDCHLEFSLAALATPRMITAVTALAIIAVLPVIIRHVKSRLNG